MFSNKYIFIFASVMVFIVALILSLAATILQPFQQANLDVEHMKGILSSAQIYPETKEVPDYYDQYVVKEITINTRGEELASYSKGNFEFGNVRAFNINLRDQLKNIESNGEGLLPLFVIEKDHELFYVIPLLGRGLWGPIWGTIAIKEDLNTVAGVTLGHKSETPGLGAEISTSDFQQQFVNKQIFNSDNEFVSVKVVKGGVANSRIVPEIHGVDAVSGGTITSDGTTDMLYNILLYYLPYFDKLRNDGK